MDTGCRLCYGSFHQPMKAKSPAIHLLAAAFLPLVISSCGTMKVVQAAKEKTTNGMSAIADASWGRFTKPKVQVVEVREKDLKDMPTGEERALAYQNQRKRSFWNFFSGPVDFKEPTLPSSAGELDGSLLPPVE